MPPHPVLPTQIIIGKKIILLLYSLLLFFLKTVLLCTSAYLPTSLPRILLPCSLRAGISSVCCHGSSVLLLIVLINGLEEEVRERRYYRKA